MQVRLEGGDAVPTEAAAAVSALGAGSSPAEASPSPRPPQQPPGPLRDTTASTSGHISLPPPPQALLACDEICPTHSQTASQFLCQPEFPSPCLK